MKWDYKHRLILSDMRPLSANNRSQECSISSIEETCSTARKAVAQEKPEETAENLQKPISSVQDNKNLDSSHIRVRESILEGLCSAE